MPRLFGQLVLGLLATAALPQTAFAEGMNHPTYQRARDGWSYGGWGNHQGPSGNHAVPHKKRHHGHHPHKPYTPPQVSGGHFQRPYPYHLDYYRMRWGGSYAPYFGNLYGPPNVVLGAPYFYGGYYGYGGGPTSVPYEAPPVVEP